MRLRAQRGVGDLLAEGHRRDDDHGWLGVVPVRGRHRAGRAPFSLRPVRPGPSAARTSALDVPGRCSHERVEGGDAQADEVRRGGEMGLIGDAA